MNVALRPPVREEPAGGYFPPTLSLSVPNVDRSNRIIVVGDIATLLLHAYATVSPDDNPAVFVLEFDFHSARASGDQRIEGVRIDDVVETTECKGIDPFCVRNSLDHLYGRFGIVRRSAIGFVGRDSHDHSHNTLPLNRCRPFSIVHFLGENESRLRG